MEKQLIIEDGEQQKFRRSRRVLGLSPKAWVEQEARTPSMRKEVEVEVDRVSQGTRSVRSNRSSKSEVAVAAIQFAKAKLLEDTMRRQNELEQKEKELAQQMAELEKEKQEQLKKFSDWEEEVLQAGEDEDLRSECSRKLNLHDKQGVSKSIPERLTFTMASFNEDVNGEHISKQTEPRYRYQSSNCENFQIAPSCPMNREAKEINEVSSVRSDMHMMLVRQTMGKDLPMFSGSIEEWPAFYSQYEATTRACGFSLTENYFRLMKALTGKARNSVQSLLVSPENVPDIIEVLKQLYGRPKDIIRSVIRKATELTPPSISKPGSIVEFAVAVRNMVATIRHLDRMEYMYNPTLLDDLVRKLPSELRLQWGIKAAAIDYSVTLDDFNRFLQEISKGAGEICDDYADVKRTTESYFPRTNEKFHRKDDRKTNSFNRERPTWQSSWNKGYQRDERIFVTTEPSKCDLCSKVDHDLTRCPEFKKMSLDIRYDFLRKEKLCFGCLIQRHPASVCRSKRHCGVYGCQKFHHPLLHKNENGQNQSELSQAVSSFHVDASKITQLSILPVKVSGSNGTAETYVMIDEGSTVTLVDHELMTEIGISGARDPLVLNTLSDGPKVDENSMRVSFEISGTYAGAKMHSIDGARTVTELGLSMQSLDFKRLEKIYPYLQGLPIASFTNAQPRIILGQSDKLLGLVRDYVHRNANEPIAFKTWLGWGICGQYEFGGHTLPSNFHVKDESDLELHELVRRSFISEEFGTTPKGEVGRSIEDKRALNIMELTTKRIGCEFETGLLWRTDDVKLPDSYNTALFRLICQEKKMDKDESFATEYERKIEEYIEKGYIRKLTSEEISQGEERIFYLPHFGVRNPNKPGKMRMVFDAAAKINGTSFNDMLLPGPDLASPMLPVLWKFRQYQFAFGGDITDMYHRVRIRKDDLPAQRFLWRGRERQRPPDVYEIQVMIFGATCSPSSAQFVKNLNATELMNEFPLAYPAILNKHYVDDFWDSKPTTTEAIDTIKEVIEVHRRGGFKICKWISNCKAILESIPEDLRAESCKDLSDERILKEVERTLGVHWIPEKDAFTFVLKFHKVDERAWKGQRVPTKRDVLKMTMSLYDPLGFIAPFVLKVKIILQDIWRSNLGWDEELSGDILKQWYSWLIQLQDLTLMKIPRCYSFLIPDAESIQLHTFVDASGKAFAACSYLRIQKGNQVDVCLVSAKTRVAPNDTMSIPRLELCGGVLGSRLAKKIRDELEINIDRTYFWTDSRVLLCWIRSESRRYRPFAAHRITEIHELTSVEGWRWVPTKQNVADDATRVPEVVELSPDARWFHGPEFLKKPASEWPMEKPVDAVDPRDLEMKQEFVGFISKTTEPIFPDVNRITRINFGSKKSFMEKLVGCCRIVLTFISMMWKKPITPFIQNIRDNDMKAAEAMVWRNSQVSSFPLEIYCLRTNKDLPSSSKILNLNPFLDEYGVMRMNSRIQNATELGFDAKFPVILDGKNWIAKEVIRDIHSKMAHVGRGTVINETRKKFWIVGVTHATRSLIRNCMKCRRIAVQPIIPMMGNLPIERVRAYDLPFSICGVDFFGPILIIQRRAVLKRYGIIFTCFNTRAISLDLCESLTSDSCIMALRRLIARRGQPKVIFSDNGTNLRGAEAELRQELVRVQKMGLNHFLEQKGIDWRFIPPGAPHFGGAWERLIRSVKTCLTHLLKDTRPTEEVLRTVLQEAEWIVNCRPLTDVSVDPENPVALTPMHFLLGARFEPSGSPGEFTDYDMHARSAWRKSQRLSDLFWKM